MNIHNLKTTRRLLIFGIVIVSLCICVVLYVIAISFIQSTPPLTEEAFIYQTEIVKEEPIPLAEKLLILESFDALESTSSKEEQKGILNSLKNDESASTEEKMGIIQNFE